MGAFYTLKKDGGISTFTRRVDSEVWDHSDYIEYSKDKDLPCLILELHKHNFWLKIFWKAEVVWVSAEEFQHTFKLMP